MKALRFALALASTLGGSIAAAQDVFIAGATLVDPAAGAAVRSNLLVVGGRIAGRPDAPPAGFSGPTLDAAGKWVIPGLHDLHTHSFGHMGADGSMQMIGTPRAAQRMLYAGVTGFLDLFSAESAILPLRDRQRANAAALPGADVFAAGPCLTATNGHCSEYGVPTRLIDTPEQARAQIAELAAKKPDVVKIVFQRGARMPTVDLPTLEAAIRAAGEHGLKTVIHVGHWEDARVAVEAGASALTHTPDDAVVPDDLVAMMVAKGAAIIPTLAVHGDIAHWFDDPKRLENPLVVALTTPALRAGYSSAPAGGFARWVETARGRKADRYASVRALAAAGVPILTGTDAGNPGTFLGYSVHRELALLVEAGLTPIAALVASTTAAGDFLDRRWGLADGDEGSVVILDGDPLEDIVNTERIHAVVHHGVVVDRATMLE
jgi:imidazolonepropionase-like amidohydrolase